MMNDVEADIAVEFPTCKVSTELPEIIMELLSPPPFLPKQSPLWKIEEHKSNIGKCIAIEGNFDSLATFVMSEHPDLVEPCSLPYGVPAHSRL
jgi:hypothetical protein